MGEVYRGYDARLDRPVALKRIRPGVGDPDLALRRFRREARAAARLRHPAIVQVHDWVESDGEAWLVMELVEGRSLREMLQAGALEPARAVGLTHDLLEGLAVAHEAGLVHRDLKADNVMVVPLSTGGRGRGEQARILDFGLAKKATPDVSQTELSAEGKILGTLSTLAPEQVLGQEIDARTDLFALGCLLYETLTGHQAFVGRSAGETINRICSVHQVPAHEHCPAIPSSLSGFVDHLLEKDPRRRPSTALDALDELDRVTGIGLEASLETLAPEGMSRATHGIPGSGSPPEPPAQRRRNLPSSAIAILLAALLAVGFFLAKPFGETVAAEPIHIAAPRTTIGTGSTGEEVELAAQAIHSALLQGLVDLRDIVPVEVPRDEDPPSGNDTRALAKTLAVDEVLRSRIDCGPHGCRAELRRLRANGEVKWTRAFSVETDRLLELGRAVLSYLPLAFPDAERRPGAADFEVRPEDYETYLRLWRRYESRDRGLASEDLLASLKTLSEASPKFLSVPIFEAHVALQRFQATRDSQDLETADAALARARALAPDNPKVLLLAARAARAEGDLAAARTFLDQVAELEPGSAEARLQLALLHEKEGDLDGAKRLALEAVDRWPSPYMLFNSADLVLRQGDVGQARQLLERGLERAPDRFNGLSRLGQLELAHGDIERAAEIYTRLVERSPEATELNNLGTAQMMLGHYDQASQTFRRVVEKSPDSPYAQLNLADVAKLSGDLATAEQHYARVLELAAADPRPERLASLKAQAFAQLGRREEAVEMIQAALRQRPEHPWVAYEAALVYALIGDRASALWNARRALDGDIEERWLDLPWFDPIRDGLSPSAGGPEGKG